MIRGLGTIGIVSLLSAPLAAETADWQDLYDRCATAVMSGEKLNVAGLQDRLPDARFRIIEGELIGPRLELEFSGPGGRTIPTGVWGSDGGQFELWLTEYPTKAGFRAICEVRQARGEALVSPDEQSELKASFDELSAGADSISVTREGLTAYRWPDANPRGCPVVSSFSAHSKMRTTVSEAAGVPSCGGPSLATDVITPHGILPTDAGEG